ncbi:MAG: TonB-dependent receptor [Rubrivivax sp.]|jgi:iron complex outermembrane receptor protein|nr:TonB-dependent receptor [Rubrivivax sp.]
MSRARNAELHRRPLAATALAQALACAGLAALALAPAQAQTTAPAAGAQKPDDKVQEVVVTATRRAEPLQKVPVAVSVLDGLGLEQANLNTLQSITTQVPSVNFRTNASNKDRSLFIRGVGTISTSPGVEPTVSTIVDGVVMARPGQATLDLLDVERIEVLRGPQGTLFGRNASAGVINVVSKSPSKAREGYIDLGYFSGGNERRIRGGVSGEFAPGVARGSVTALAGKFDGNVTNIANGEKVNGYDKQGARAKVELTPNRDLKVTLSADYLKSEDTVPLGVVTRTSLIAFPSGVVSTFPAFATALAPAKIADDSREINSDIRTRVEDTNAGVSAMLDWNLGGGHTLTSITAQRTWKNRQIQDGDRLSAPPSTAFPSSNDDGRVDFKQTTQELRIASPGGQTFDYVAGFFYLKGDNDEVYRRDVKRIISGATQADFGVADYGTQTTSWAVFGEGTWRFSPGLRGVVGLRYTKDELEFRHLRTSTQAAAFPGVSPGQANATGTTSTHGTSGRIGPQFDLAPGISGYATYSRGYKGPAFNVFFNMLERDRIAIAPETSDSYEVGLKTTLLDNKLRLNVAIFDTRYKNYQANFFDTVAGTVVTRLINAGEVGTKGIEMDFTAKPTTALTVSGSVANIKARIRNFNCPPGAATSCQVNGLPLPFAPDWKAAVQATYRWTLAGGMGLELGTDYAWQSKTQYDIGQFPDTVQPEYGIWNASVALSSSSGWRAAFLVKNITDKSYASFLGRGGTFLSRAVPRDDTRYYGVNLRYDF